MSQQQTEEQQQAAAAANAAKDNAPPPLGAAQISAWTSLHSVNLKKFSNAIRKIGKKAQDCLRPARDAAAGVTGRRRRPPELYGDLIPTSFRNTLGPFNIMPVQGALREEELPGGAVAG